MVKVSVVIPVYNAEKHLAQCVESLLCQTLDDIEIICVDDGSKDSSPKIISEYCEKDCRVRLIRQENAGAGDARNNGMKYANGEYIIFLDADDFFEPSMFYDMYSKAAAEDADICLCGGRKYNDMTGEMTHAESFLKMEYLPEKTSFSPKDISHYLYNIVTPAPWTKLFKKSFVEETGLQFMRLKKANDLFFTYCHLALAKKITYVAADLVNYRIENVGSIQGQKKFTYDFYEAFRAAKRELIKRGVFRDFEQSFVNRALISCFYELDRVDDKETFIDVVGMLEDEVFYNLGILGHSRGYFYSKEYYSRAVKLLESEPEALWEEKAGAQAETTKPLIDIEKWVSPIEIKNDGEIKVSVIIPVYNTENYLEECVNSAIVQTLRDIEIICVDDGSTDSSPEILKRLAENDGRIKIITKENGGPSQARNVALDVAKGEYIAFIDSDDYFEPRALEYLYAEAKNENLDDLFFSAKTFTNCDHSVSEYDYTRKADYNGVMTGREMFEIMSANAEFKPPACFQLLKRSFMEENKIRFIEGVFYEDNPFTIECCFHAERTRYDNINLYNRRLRDSSTMTKSSGFKSSYSYYMVINYVKAMAVRLRFSDYPDFYKAILKQLERIRSVAVDFSGDAGDDEFFEFISALDEKSAVDYYFYVKTAKAYGARIKTLSRESRDSREKAVMNSAKRKCKQLEDERRMQAEIDKKSAEINALKQQINELKEQSIKNKFKKFINK